MITDELIQAGVTPELAFGYLATFVPPFIFLYLLRKSGAGTEPATQEQATQEVYHTQNDYPHQQ